MSISYSAINYLCGNDIIGIKGTTANQGAPKSAKWVTTSRSFAGESRSALSLSSFDYFGRAT